MDQRVKGGVPILALRLRRGGNRVVPHTGLGKKGRAPERRCGNSRAGADCRIKNDRGARDDIA